MNEPALTGYQTRTVNLSSAEAMILLLSVLAIIGTDIVLIYYQFALAPFGGVASDVPHAVLTNTAWVLDKISVGGGTILLVMALKHLFFTQSMSQFLLCAVSLAVHIATVYIVDPAVVTPFIAIKVQDLF
ncbi:hypothetical protein [Pseudomonas sp. 460]|uniref:hypothetical protein n=1 Tax=Pseudomonas sp. 460 TaxID=2485142 RepID=UPI00104BB699|nr:hypothetical protein [Pseudomonas sp. 460]TCV51530.1 hypothetical protein EDB99_107196 [Pseudomonas sp. 460]